MLPQARTDRLLVTDVDDEVVVYDLERQRAHNLNHTAALVWRSADGERSEEDLSALVSARLDVDDAQDIVRVALKRLSDAYLLREPVGDVTDQVDLTRRNAMRRLAAVGIGLLPVVRSIAAPTPAMAQSLGGGIT